MKENLDWGSDGQDWPNRAASRFVNAGGLTWHVQQMGSGPVALLVHGTGSSTHSWAGLAPLLSRNYTVVTADLPGHAFTTTPDGGGLTLPGMANLLRALLASLGAAPQLAIGHSAGSAILIRMALDRHIAPEAIVSINGALLPFGGFAAPVFSPLAKLMFLNPFVPRLFVWRARSLSAVRRVLEGTGSVVDDRTLEFYARLFQSVRHINGTLGMMANWDLEALELEMGALKAPLFLLAASKDTAVRPGDADRIRRRISSASVHRLEGLGHLAHEEDPEAVWAAIRRLTEAPLRGAP